MRLNELLINGIQLDAAGDWERPNGFPPGITQKILSGKLDEKAKTGTRTRIVKYEPGADTRTPFIHDFWEEGLLISGDTTDYSGGTLKSHSGIVYWLRPPGTTHGPFVSKSGCLLLEIQYYR